MWQCVRDQTEQIEKIPPPPPPPIHFIFIFVFFCLLLFAMFCIDMGHFLFFTIFGTPDIERRKKKEESSHRPATRIFVRK